MLGGRQVRIDVREPGQEETETEAQPEEHPLYRSTRAHTQADSRSGT